MASNPRLTNRKAYEERRAYVRRLVAQGAPCGICGQPIDLDAPQWVTRDGRRIRAPWSLECDEIVPLARGGALSIQNSQPAHRACNQRKGAGRRPEQASRSIAGSTSREW